MHAKACKQTYMTENKCFVGGHAGAVYRDRERERRGREYKRSGARCGSCVGVLRIGQKVQKRRVAKLSNARTETSGRPPQQQY